MDNICIPMHLDAFALSPACCDEQLHSRIAPYTQPNYTALRLNDHLLQHDVLDFTDFHNTQPATSNPRTADIGISPPNNLKLHRMGVHLQWSLPRLYRAASASGKDTTINKAPKDKDPTQPVFRVVPNRWLITRRLRDAPWPSGMSEYQSWIVESDSVQYVKDIPSTVDIESGVAPFVSYLEDPDHDDVLNSQTEVFLGQKFDLDKWPGTSKRTILKQGLTVMTSSNPIFADYALHNTNVLSIIDNFAYPRNTSDNNPRDDNFSYMSNAHCDYFVIGWHDDSTNDPLNNDDDTLKTRLTSLLLKLNPIYDPNTPDTGDASQLRDKKDKTRCLIHGAIYDVKYDFSKQPNVSLVEENAKNFRGDTRMEPISIGTTPLDGILTFLDAHKQDSPGADLKFFGPDGEDLPKYILELSTLLYAAGDDYDSRVQAQDLIAQQNYAKSDGGSYWTFSSATTESGNTTLATKGKPKIPSFRDQGNLQKLNENQTRLDVTNRKLLLERWELFAEWFKYKSEFIADLNKEARFKQYQDIVGPLKDSINALIALKTDLQGQLSTLQGQVDCKISTRDPYQQRTDPTLCIAGIDSGWPTDVMDTLQIRLDSELTKDTALLVAVDGIFAATSNGRPKTSNPIPLDHGLRDTATKILAECLRDTNATTKNGMKADPTITGFQAWGDRNPFAPLFIEWESMYYHIEMKYWDVQLRPSRVGHAQPQIRYAPSQLLVSGDAKSDQQNADDNQNNFRTLSGRVLVLPQPRFSLESVLLQVLTSKSPDIPPDIQGQVLADLQNNIGQIKFISAPLSGLTNHLLTRCDGAHVRPTVRMQGGKVQALKAADAPEIFMDYQTTLPLIDGGSALTPYGALMTFEKDEYHHNPFKPATHGQMIFTKLNIIDKFGQAICLPERHRLKVIEPNPPDPAIYPCLSDYLTPGIVKPDSKKGTSGTFNTVFPLNTKAIDGQWPSCPYIQLTPNINQDARINGAFLKQDSLGSPWREVFEYESPIWGWIVINYADNGLQFFLGDGRFYREIRRGGVSGTNVSAKWLPYGPPDQNSGPQSFSPNDPAVALLDQLIKLFTSATGGDDGYLLAFSSMINGAIQTMPFPPSSYAGYANAIVGKPLALVNAGWSIELAEPPVKPQFDSIDQTPGQGQWKGEMELQDYVFHLKIGDEQRNYDGVVGYYTADKVGTDDAQGPLPDPLQTISMNNLYTYFMPDPPLASTSKNQFVELVPDKYLRLSPYYTDPEPKTTSDMAAAHNRKYHITGLLIDPYTAIHAYSPILPTKSLQLPAWTIQAAMDRMHAFFRLGPCLVTDDVPTTYAAANATNPATQTPLVSVNLPVSGAKGTWTWLQPYAQDGFDAEGKENLPQFATMGVAEDLGTTKFEPAPYTFLEGYLQLMGKLDNKGDGGS
ncbi:hypothetical protein PV11_08778 [Exophiala sideris]|uniref:Uncharacterized protein n=1 Tax=Exophiala sideris TaxID=1016849 RepID=A0A0D1Y7X8_9EURO|nr:hypothetical protein PV11_08778 [Exophiala sideris]